MRELANEEIVRQQVREQEQRHCEALPSNKQINAEAISYAGDCFVTRKASFLAMTSNALPLLRVTFVVIKYSLPAGLLHLHGVHGFGIKGFGNGGLVAEGFKHNYGLAAIAHGVSNFLFGMTSS